jgi:flagellum-specific peptidoglycan hydrolase FlgJ
MIYKMFLMYFLISLTPDLKPKNNKEYIYKYYPIALYCEIKYGVPVSIQLAQAIQESGAGRSNIAKNSNNHFGIKYYKNAFKGKYYTDRIGVKWRAYDSVTDSYIDHAKFLNQHYNKVCFKNYTQWSKLKGYGEHKYWQTIINIIKQSKLHNYDLHKHSN